MLGKLSGLLLLLGLLHVTSAAIPSYIQVCKLNDPNRDQCIINSINALKPRLVKGIPELDVPPLDPLFFDEFVISKGGNFNAIGKNVVVRGAANINITHLKSEIGNVVTYDIGLEVPYINIAADYDVNMKLLAVNLRGKGPLKLNNTEVTAKVLLKGRKIKKDKATYVLFDTLDMKIKWKNYNVRLENLFGGDKPLGDAVNAALNDNKKEITDILLPRVERNLGDKLISIANKVTLHFRFDELFPLK